MKFSVLIPAYNASKTIELTLNSVLRQSCYPFEILVMDGGSTDGTLSILETYEPRIKVYHQEDKGLGAARNFLCRMARGDAIAFLDSDDIWHAKYLETQKKVIAANPRAVASFTGHVDFYGLGEYKWNSDPVDSGVAGEQIEPIDFFRRYTKAAGPFACVSYCCVPKRVLDDVGPEPFGPTLTHAEDCYFFYLLTLKGPVVRIPNKLVAYRIIVSSLSQDQLTTFRHVLMAFELIKDTYEKNPSPALLNAYHTALASKMRFYAKILIGLGESSEARKVLIKSIAACSDFLSICKSSYLMAAMNFPRIFKRHWIPRYREINSN